MANIEIGGRLHSTATGNVVTGANEVLDDIQNKKQQEINAELIEAVGTGGSVDSRIAAAKAEIKGTATSACDTLGEAEAKINANTTAISNEATRAEAAEEALDGRVDTLETAVGTGGSVDSRISAAVATETTRAQAAEADRYTKSETYTKTEVNGLVDTPHQEYVTVDAYASLPATGSKDTIYRVSNYNGSTSQVDASVYSEYAWNGTQYVFLCVKSQIGEVFDISVYNNNAKYADLAAALNGGANIPQSLQKGGMSVKFVQSSDNKYIQYRLMADSWSVDTDDWAISEEGVLIENPEYIYVKTDSEGKILWAIKTDGSIYYGAGVPQQIIDYITEQIVDIDNTKLDAEGLDSNALKTIQVVDNPEWISAITDKDGRVLEGITFDGKKKILVETEIDGVNVGEIGQRVSNNENNIDSLNDRVDEIESVISDDNQIKVTFNTTNKTIEIRSKLSDNYDIINSMFWNNDDSYNRNPCLNYGGTSLIDLNNNRTAINNEHDNLGPLYGNIGYIGANHGLDKFGNYVVTNHGKAFVDIGSKWTDGSNEFVLVQISDENNLCFVPYYNINDGIISFSNLPDAGVSLEHVSGATNTSTIILGTRTIGQWLPSEAMVSVKFILDGKELLNSGLYYGKTLDCIEVYDVYDPSSYLDVIISKVGTFTENPLPHDYKDIISKYVRYSNDYRFMGGGLNVLIQDLLFLRKIQFSQLFPLNIKPMNINAFGGTNTQYYLPKALPITLANGTYDFRVPKNFIVNDSTIRWQAEYWENPLLPPDRAIMFLCNQNDRRIVGLHYGFIFNQGVGSGTNRKDYCSEWIVYSNGGAHGLALDAAALGSIKEPYTHYGMVCFRKYEDYSENREGVISVSKFEVNNQYYIYADFESAGIYNIEIPAEWCGKEFTVFEKSNNIEVLCSLSTSPMTIKVGSADPMYGYAVIGINKDKRF